MRASYAQVQLKPTGSSWSNRLIAGTGYMLISSTPQHCGAVLLMALLAGPNQYCLWYWCKREEPEVTWTCLCMLGEWQRSIQPWVEVLPGIKGLNGSAQKEGQNIQHLTWTCLHFFIAHTDSLTSQPLNIIRELCIFSRQYRMKKQPWNRWKG